MTRSSPIKWFKLQWRIVKLLLVLVRRKEGRAMLRQVSRGEIPESFVIAWPENWVRDNKEILDRFD